MFEFIATLISEMSETIYACTNDKKLIMIAPHPINVHPMPNNFNLDCFIMILEMIDKKAIQKKMQDKCINKFPSILFEWIFFV